MTLFLALSIHLTLIYSIVEFDPSVSQLRVVRLVSVVVWSILFEFFKASFKAFLV